MHSKRFKFFSDYKDNHMNPIFVNRVVELDFLNKIYKKNGKQLIIIYGRRRVGKTELINHFCINKKSVYFLADKRGTLSNARRFAKLCAEHFKDVEPQVNNFDDAFSYIKKRLGKEKTVITIDEFSYLVEKDQSISSVFQLVFDEILKETNIVLILCGSSISMMYKGTLSYESPLYGRRTGEWLLKKMSFKEISNFFQKDSFEEKVRKYAVVGGIPAYAKHFLEKKTIEEIELTVLKKGEVLYNEPEILLKEELRDPSSYFSILEAMSKTTKLTEIANLANIPAKDLPKYFKVLEDLELIYKAVPVTEGKSKKASYFIKDNFFRFWFKFVFPKKSELESGKISTVLLVIKREFNAFVGLIFEQICLEYLKEQKILPFTKIGKWWGHSRKNGKRVVEEIDIVSIDERGKTILFAECKWQEKVDAEKVLNALIEKAKKVEWFNNERKEYYAVFAKSFAKKTELKNCFLFELKHLQS